MKKRIARMLGVLVLGVAVVAVAVVVAARFHDGPFGGPLEIVSAGPFTSGTLHEGPDPDWSFLRDRSTVQFQSVEPPRSRTTWILEHEGRIFIVSGYMNSFVGRLWKQWPHHLAADGRAVLRVDGILYERQMVRIQEGEVLRAVLDELGRKYVGSQIPDDQVTTGDLWVFELLPRA